MAIREIRIYGDPVLKAVADKVTDINGRLVSVVDDMIDTLMETSNGIGLAANQIGIDKQIFVYDLDSEGDPQVIINPVITESDGEWTYEEGCLSVPGLRFPIVRPKVVNLKGIDLDGNELEIEADELFGRLIQHEIDHLNGKLMLEYLDPDQLKEAKKTLREYLTNKANESYLQDENN
jgi:peptide deformylase